MSEMLSTTLSVALGVTDSQIQLADASGIPTGLGGHTPWTLYCEREAMSVISIPGGTFRVLRGANGTKATAHPAGATVWKAPSSAYGLADPSGTYAMPQGQYVPLVVIPTGNIWNDVDGSWTQVGSGGSL